MSLSRSTSKKAVASLVLGALSLVGGLVFTGVPAILVGLAGLREVNASDGVLSGKRLAWTGMALGALGSLVCVAGVSARITLWLHNVSTRAQCQNNLREIGIALGMYHDKNGSFPAGTVPRAGLEIDQRLSWLSAILPYVEQQPGATYDPNKRWSIVSTKLHTDLAWDAEANRDAVNEHVRWFACPARADRPVEGHPGITTYPGVAGVGKDAANLPVDDPRVGVFGYDRKTRRGQVTRGVSLTAAVAETAWRIGPWAAGGFTTVRGLDPTDQPYLGPDRPWGGLHSHVAYLLFVDGRVGGYRDDAAPEVLEAAVRIKTDEPAHVK